MAVKFNFAEAREKAIRVADQELEQGLEQMEEQGGRPAPRLDEGRLQDKNPSLNGGESMPAAPAEHGTAGETAVTPTAPAEPTKGVQTYIPISQYRRLNDIKLTRGENIAALAAQAINLWLDVQEGKLEVKSPEL